MAVGVNGLSFKRNFFQGIVSGVGWALGATFVFTIGLAILGALLTLLGQVPVVGNLFKPVVEIIQQSVDPRPSVVEHDLKKLQSN